VCYWVDKPFTIFLQSHDGELVFDSARAVLRKCRRLGGTVIHVIRQLWSEDSGQDVAEYAVMLAVILVIVIGTVRLIGGNANNVFSQVGSSMATQ
jgi:Flp pilus assembly pilin Flp